MAKMTILGMQRYLKWYGDTLFKNMIMPDGIDKNLLIDNILLKSGEFEVVYSDAEFTQEAIGVWSKKWYKTFEKWQKALDIEYNPLENYDRMEEWQDDTSSKSKGTTSNEVTDAFNSSNTSTKSAYNSDSYEADSKIDVSSSDHNESSSTLTSEGENKNVRTGRAHGNIGVTTSQQMLESELTIARWNIYENITDVFLQEFVIPIY